VRASFVSDLRQFHRRRCCRRRRRRRRRHRLAPVTTSNNGWNGRQAYQRRRTRPCADVDVSAATASGVIAANTTVGIAASVSNRNASIQCLCFSVYVRVPHRSREPFISIPIVIVLVGGIVSGNIDSIDGGERF
jgi:hypothetical protein